MQFKKLLDQEKQWKEEMYTLVFHSLYGLSDTLFKMLIFGYFYAEQYNDLALKYCASHQKTGYKF